MILALMLVLAQPQAAQVHTELQVEALLPPDRRAELGAEISRAQAELEEMRIVAAALPEGEAKEVEEKRLTTFSAQLREMRSLVSALPEAPQVAIVNRPAIAQPVVSPPPSSSSIGITLAFGLILGVLLAFALVFRILPGGPPAGSMRLPHLAVISALLAAVGPQLQSLGYDQPFIVVLWALLSIGAVLRLGMRRMRFQLDAFALDRARRNAEGE
jgi:ElaB/YqjD/DUF883 family membrane-anchored ribosome-binding protein